MPFCPFYFGVSGLKLNSRKKGTLIINGLLGNLGTLRQIIRLTTNGFQDLGLQSGSSQPRSCFKPLSPTRLLAPESLVMEDMWVVVKIMVPFWVPIIIRGLI